MTPGNRSRVLRRAGAGGVAGLLVALLGGLPAAAGPVDDHLAAGRWADAAAAARAALEGAPEAGETWRGLGEALAAVGDYAGARSAFERAIATGFPGRLAAEVAAARLELLAGEEDAARARLGRVLDAYRAGSRSMAARDLAATAEAARLLGRDDAARYRAAVRIYEQAVARDPDDLSIRVGLGDLFLEKYNNAEAVAIYREVLERDERHAPALLGLARSHHFDHSRTAKQVVEAALEIQPDLVPARVLLARLEVELENYGAASREIERALAVNPNSPEALTLAAAVRHLEADGEGFERAVARVREAAPGYGGLYETLAEIAAQNRLYDDAAGFAEAGVTRDPRSWRAHGLLGINRLRLGDLAGGRRSLETAFRGDPFNVWFKNTLDLLDRLEDFAAVEDGRFVLVAAPHEAPLLAPLLFPLAEAAYDHFSERYGYTPPTPVRIEFYPRHEDFSVRTMGLVGIDILGVSFGPTVALDSPSGRPFGTINWGSVVWHELAHTFHLGMSDHRVPRWFSEGLAVHEERRARPGWGDDVSPGFLDAFAAGRLPPASRLNDAFLRPEYPEQIGYGYFLASLLVQWIEERHGIAAIRDMLAGYREGRTTDQLVASRLGLAPDAFDAAVAGHVRARFGHALAALAGEAGGGAYRIAWQGGQEAMEADRLDEARTRLEAAKALFPEYAGPDSPYHLLAALHVRRGDTAAAIAELTRVVEINADDLDAHRRLADLLLAAGDGAAAADVLRRALFIQPFEPRIRERLADIHESAGEWRRAVAERAAAAALTPADPAAARYRLARALARAGRWRDARREVIDALADAPMYDDALELLLEVREELAREREAD